MEQIFFTPIQLVTILGMAQSLYALVYMAFRAGRLSRAGLAILYFFTLFCGFLYDFSEPFLGGSLLFYSVDLSWFIWFLLPSLSYLLVVQLGGIEKTPHLYNYGIILLPFCAYAFGHFMFDDPSSLYVFGMISGALSLLLVWARKSVLSDLWEDKKAGSARYWLVVCLIAVNVIFLGVTFLLLVGYVSMDTWNLLKNVLGLGFVYLASTSLFRIYPQAVLVRERREIDAKDLHTRALIHQLEELLITDKVYQEPQYGRKDFARELDVSETIVSALINQQFGGTVPQILNRYRLDEAKGLLRDTKYEVQVISQEVGFNSLTTFNRVFKDLEGVTPTQYRSSI